MNEEVRAQLSKILDAEPRSIERLHGGCIAEVYGVHLLDSKVVAKVDDRGDLRLESFMLTYLKDHSALPVPEVIHSSDTLLVLEYLPGSPQTLQRAEPHAAELFAALHEVRAEHYGLEKDTLIGPLPQPNPQTASWVDFFREHRLLYMKRLALESGNLPERLGDKLESLAQDLLNLLDEPPHPSLIHGDIWSSNVLAQGGKITGILDPALYYADAEMELAYISLFSTFGQTFFERYAELRGVREGFDSRKGLYNLYPLLVHVALFGGGYARRVEGVLRRFDY